MGRQPVVLCIDDNLPGLITRKALLEAKGFRVRTAQYGRAGLEIIKRDPVDAVILDYKMPGMDGGAVAKELRRTDPNIRILLLSGYPGQIPNWLLSLADGFIEKGDPVETLLREVERVTGANPGAVPQASETLDKDASNRLRSLKMRQQPAAEANEKIRAQSERLLEHSKRLMERRHN